MPRSIKKGPYVDSNIMEKIERMENTGRKGLIKTWARRSTIAPEFIGYTFAIHNGRRFIPILVTENMVGHKLGEFAPTRTFRSHSRGEKSSNVGTPRGLSAAEIDKKVPSATKTAAVAEKA